MNNRIETNQSYQKFKEIVTARHIISQWLSTGSVLTVLISVITSGHQPASQSARLSQPVTR